uniref:Uncharacterized protein n=1 Tax=Zea mays TaxID=4577 RepID=C4J6A5_MAIZE|nr:unknown [Zea mays]
MLSSWSVTRRPASAGKTPSARESAATSDDTSEAASTPGGGGGKNSPFWM